MGGVETWAQTTEKVVFADQGYTNNEKVASYVGKDFSIAFEQGETYTSVPTYSKNKYLRLYAGNIMTISSSTKMISKVVFTYSGSNKPSAAISYNLSSGSYSVKYNTWTADAKNQTQSVTFTNANTAQYRIQTIEVTFASGEESVATPTITPASQEFDAPFVATIACTTTGATIYYTLDGTDPTTSSPSRKTYTSEGVSIAATTTLKACASLNGKNSSVASATYTYSQTYANLKELKANAENGKTYKVKLTDAIVTLTNGYNCYIEDATAGILYYKKNHGYIKGDKLNGVATVTYVVFNGTNEITSLEGDITKEADATIPCTTVTLSDILNNTAQYESMRVKVEMAVAKDIFKDNKDNNDRDATIADGDLELPLYNGFASSTYKEFRENAYVNVTGYPYMYVKNSTSTPTLKVWTGDIEAVKDDAVKITDAQYGTAYYADAFFMPTGATGYVAESNGNGGITLKETYAEGELVPAKTALVLNAPKGNYDICLAESDAIAPTNNLLHGTTTEKLTEVEGGTYKYYKLSYNNEGNNLGFYWGSENGAAFTNGAHKAYLALDSETLLSQSRGFSLADLAHGVTTGINTTVKSATQSNFIYDLNGRRINSLNGAAKGVYIMNGQKVLVK